MFKKLIEESEVPLRLILIVQATNDRLTAEI